MLLGQSSGPLDLRVGPALAKWETFMRLIFIVAASSLAAGQAMAQESTGWSGAYGGVEAGVSGLANTRATIDIEPGRWPGATYPAGVMTGRTFETEVSSQSKAALGAFMGLTFDTFGLVAGGEVNVLISPVEREYSLGPVSSIRTGDPRAVTFPLPASTGAPAGSVGAVLSETDSIHYKVRLDDNVSLRGRIGLPVGDIALLSAYAGVAMTNAQIDFSQHSAQTGAFFFGTPEQSIPLSNSGDSNIRKQQTLFGTTFGALAEYRLSTEWTGRLDFAYTQFEEASATDSVGSTIDIKPRTWSITTGFSRSF
jgi:opacity protein-like surface antigen